MLSQLRSILPIIVLLFLGLNADAQSKKERRAAKQQADINESVQQQMEKQFGKSEIPPSAYKEAERLVDAAINALTEGYVNKADSLIDLSIKIYPTHKVFQFVKAVFKLPNASRATAIMDELYERVRTFEHPELIMEEPYPSTYVNGKMTIGLKKYNKDRALFNFGNNGFLINREFGSFNWGINILEKITALKFSPIKGLAYDYEKAAVENHLIALNILKRNFSEALRLTGEMKVSDYSPQQAKDQMLAYVYFEKGDYDKALTITDAFPEQNNVGKHLYGFMINALKGNNEKAIQHYTSYIQLPYVRPNNLTFYFLAITDINKGDFNAALRNLDSTLNFRASGDQSWMASFFLVDRWKVYNSLGDAYAGLKQYDKARDNYNIALLANPDYEPAIAALTKLESSIATTTSTDKTPPRIAVTEPSVKRGLQVTTSGNDVMVRGIAEDPSGLKSVSINGQSVYAQASGNFWGNIVLKNGLNKITIKATDGAGNIAEQTFEITKNAATTPETEIVAVTAKEGKNYCLLIAAQNYSDVSIPSLENPIQDAVRLKLVLKKNYNFTDENIITLFNPNANDIKRQLLELTNVIQPEDNLLIFYAGHGIWVEKEKKGYWLMTDAKRNDPNTWVSNKDVLSLIAKLPSRHTLLITDACFSGGVFKTRSISKDAPSAIQMMDAKVSRVAITSGNDTEVPDQSVFMKYLVKALSENKDQYMPAQKMFITHIMEAVMTEGKTEPRYGTLELAGHVGGDFIFTKK